MSSEYPFLEDAFKRGVIDGTEDCSLQRPYGESLSVGLRYAFEATNRPEFWLRYQEGYNLGFKSDTNDVLINSPQSMKPYHLESVPDSPPSLNDLLATIAAKADLSSVIEDEISLESELENPAFVPAIDIIESTGDGQALLPTEIDITPHIPPKEMNNTEIVARAYEAPKPPSMPKIITQTSAANVIDRQVELLMNMKDFLTRFQEEMGQMMNLYHSYLEELENEELDAQIVGRLNEYYDETRMKLQDTINGLEETDVPYTARIINHLENTPR